MKPCFLKPGDPENVLKYLAPFMWLPKSKYFFGPLRKADECANAKTFAIADECTLAIAQYSTTMAMTGVILDGHRDDSTLS